MLLPTAILLSIGIVSAGRSPGILAAIKPTGVHYAAQVGMQLFEQNLRTVKIPDVLSDPTGTDFFQVGLTDIQFDSLYANHNDISLYPLSDSGLKLQADKVQIRLHGNYFFRVGTTHIHVAKRGRLSVHMADAELGGNFHLGMSVGGDGRGRPAIGSSMCNAAVGKIELEFHGDILDWLLNALRSLIDLALKPLMHKIICDQLNYDIDHDIDTKLLNIPMVAAIPGTKGVMLDLGLTRAPTVEDDQVTAAFKGLGFLDGDNTLTSFHPAAMSPLMAGHHMVTVAVADAVLNSLSSAWFKTGAMGAVVTRDAVHDLSPANAHYLNITCTDYMCLGALLPTVAQKFENASLWIRARASKAPEVQFLEIDQTFEVALDVNLDMRALYDTGAIIPIFDADVSVGIIVTNLSLHAEQSGLILKAQSIDTTTPVTKLNSINVDGVNEEQLGGVFQFAIPFAVSNYAQTPVQAGYAIPVDALPVHINDPYLHIYNGSVAVATDLSF